MTKNDLATKLIQISHPTSNNYCGHLIHQELRDFTTSSVETVELVESWLKSVSRLSGLTYIGNSGTYSFDITASAANDTLLDELAVFVEPISGDTVGRSLKYSPPQQISGKIALTHAITHFPRAKSSVMKQAAKLAKKTPITNSH